MTVPLPPARGGVPRSASGMDRTARSTYSQSQPQAPQSGVPEAWEALIGAVEYYARLAIARDNARDAPGALDFYRRAVTTWHTREGRVRLPPQQRESIAPQIRTYEARAAALEAASRGMAADVALAGAEAVQGAPASAVAAGLASRVADTRVDTATGVGFDAIAGCDTAKLQLLGALRLPLLAPQLFKRGRAAPRGILLYGPPGTGKTMLARAAAGTVKTQMFAIEAADVTDKYLGESEKFIKALFETARANAPAIVFIDEIDALLGTRRTDESDAVRRIKNQFFTAIQGFRDTDARVLVIGATNRPWDLDDAALRRFEQRIYVPLPDAAGRHAIFEHLLRPLSPALGDADFARFAAATSGFSGADVAAVVRAAAMLPIAPLVEAQHVAPGPDGRYRASTPEAAGSIAVAASQDLSHLELFDEVGADDVRAAMARFRPSVTAATLQQFADYEADAHP